MHEVILICDGSAIGNPGPSGWACILKLKPGGQERIVTGSHPASTNNRAELMAAIDGLRTLKQPCRIELISDSQYLKKGITEWLPKWRMNGWVAASGKPVLNQDLWHQLEELVQQHEIRWSWMRGHATDVDQNRADRLAAQAAREQSETLAPA